VKRSYVKLAALVLALSLGLSGLLAGAADTLPALRRKLLEANGTEQVNQALFDLSEKVGEAAFFDDHAAFALWLSELPDGRAENRLVRQRIGWAWILAKQGGKAIAPLEAALKDDPSDGLTRAYLGEALRQAKRFDEVAAMLASAVMCGERSTFVHDAIVATLVQLRATKIAGHADELPEYALAGQAYLQADPDPRVHHMIADMLLTDFKTYEKPERARGQQWAEAAGRHLLAALEGAREPLAGADQIAYDAAVALAVLDEKSAGGSLRFDLLAQAYRLGRNPADGTHARPQVLTWLAEGAARDERFELAYRLAQERLAISDSARARRLLMRLPPDLGGEE
jgi:hypothetical protein